MKKENSGIYRIFNILDGKFYDGSSNNLKKREYQHFYDLKKNKHANAHLQNAYNKHGEEAFVFVVLEECPVDKLIEIEQHYLDTDKAWDRNVGYNVSAIAGRIEANEETRNKKSVSMKGKFAGEKNPNWKKAPTTHTRALMSESAKNRPPITEETRIKLCGRNKGIPRSYEVRKKISLAQSGNKAHNAKLTETQTDEIRTLYETGKYTQKQLGIMFNVARTTIQKVVENRTWKK